MPAKRSIKPIPHHFLWSIFFLAATFAAYIYIIWIGSSLGLSATWVFGALISSGFALFLVGYERRTGRLGKGKFLWSVFFTTLTLAVSIYLAINFLMFITVLPLITAFIALFLLIHEKYYY